jgi:UDP-3-O-[3-hydroxymyristoyl] glucosamine N-acyltransferase
MRLTAKELAILLDAQIDGNPDSTIEKLVKIEEADSKSLCFIANPKYDHYAANTHAGILVVGENFKIKNNNGTTFLRVNDPYSSFVLLLEKFANQANAKSGIEEGSYVDDTAQVDPSCYVGAFAYIGKNVKLAKGVQVYPHCYVGDDSAIEEDTILYAGVKLYNNTQIGKRTILHAGVVAGSDGFGFAPQKDGSFLKVPQTGNVTIGNDVEIGANTVIDRATLGSTQIANGVKVDNLVQIAHNVIVGPNSVIAAQAGISGSTKLGKNVMVGGQAGLVGHITIADGVKINAQSGVSKNVEEKGAALTGTPAENFRQHYKHIAQTRKIVDLIARIELLEQVLTKKNS